MKKNNFQTLTDILLENSKSDNLYDAIKEWEVIASNDLPGSTCLCSKTNIKTCFTIKNVVNDKVLFPIGNHCIRKFNNDDLINQAKLSQMGKMILRYGKYKDELFEDVVKHNSWYIQYLEDRRKLKIQYSKLIDYYYYVLHYQTT